MKILMTGSHGLVGRRLLPSLKNEGHEISVLVRGQGRGSNQVAWNPPTQGPDAGAIQGTEAVVHLAGETIAALRWTEAKKRRIRESRVASTQALVKSLLALDHPPKVFVSASAIGIYGDRGEEVLRESSTPASTFLSTVCQEWEGAAQPLKERGVRVVHLRFGMILARSGGALATMRPAFLAGLGGEVGSGRQYISWVSLTDVVDVIGFALHHDALQGPVNTVAPDAVTNQVFAATLGRVLHRPAIVPLPAFAVHMFLGEMGDALLLSSTRVLPEKLLQSGYSYRYPTLEAALRHELSRRD